MLKHSPPGFLAWTRALARTISAPGASFERRILSTIVESQDSSEVKGGWWTNIVLYIPAALSGCLAYWQYERMSWKDSLITSRTAALDKPPVDVYELSVFEDYRKVHATGQYMHANSVFVGPRPRAWNGKTQPGYILITPLFDPKRRGVVLVNRGWVPSSWRQDVSGLRASAPSSSVVVQGLLQPDENPAAFLTSNDPSRGEFTFINSRTIAKSLELPEDTPLIQVVVTPAEWQAWLDGRQRGEPPPLPLAKHLTDIISFSVMPRDHLGYAVTWGVLAGVLVACAHLANRSNSKWSRTVLERVQPLRKHHQQQP